MKVVILAGGFGTRISEETSMRPKPMIEIGGMPILEHIMRHYSKFGFTEFIICLGYRGNDIKKFFANYTLLASDVHFDFKEGTKEFFNSRFQDWKVTLVDTGIETMTGGRVRRIKEYLDNEPNFFLTYGDGLSDVNIDSLYDFHVEQQSICTLTAVAPPGRFGSVKIKNSRVTEFIEKPLGDGGLINGGFFVCSSKVLDYIEGDKSVLERDVLSVLAENNNLSAYRHDGFWRPMDTLRDKLILEEMWKSGKAPWK